MREHRQDGLERSRAACLPVWVSAAALLMLPALSATGDTLSLLVKAILSHSLSQVPQQQSPAVPPALRAGSYRRARLSHEQDSL